MPDDPDDSAFDVDEWRRRRLMEHRAVQKPLIPGSPEAIAASELAEALRPRAEAEQRANARLKCFGDHLIGSRGLWHTTRPDRYRMILDSGALVPEPPIPESERHSTACGPEKYPFVRHIGGVSLFDFSNTGSFTEYETLYPGNSLGYFVPIQPSWSESVWIDIDREAIFTAILRPEDVLQRWKASRNCCKLMALVEAAHIGPVPRSAFRRAFQVERRSGMIKRVAT